MTSSHISAKFVVVSTQVVTQLILWASAQMFNISNKTLLEMYNSAPAEIKQSIG